jgi:FkbM family methyltransferase
VNCSGPKESEEELEFLYKRSKVELDESQKMIWAEIWKYGDEKLRRDIAALTSQSNSQLLQEVIVISILNRKRNGYFVEIGACDGVLLSNTLALEKCFDWKGILVEPARVWHENLFKNRTATIETSAIDSLGDSQEMFAETCDPSGRGSPELSSLDKFVDNGDWASEMRKNYRGSYPVNVLTLQQLLDKYAAPRIIDYLSIDTEGSEFDIIKNFDFRRRCFRVISVEHNFQARRELIRKHLLSFGYVLFLPDHTGWDDIYILKRNYAILKVDLFARRIIEFLKAGLSIFQSIPNSRFISMDS